MGVSRQFPLHHNGRFRLTWGLLQAPIVFLGRPWNEKYFLYFLGYPGVGAASKPATLSGILFKRRHRVAPGFQNRSVLSQVASFKKASQHLAKAALCQSRAQLSAEVWSCPWSDMGRREMNLPRKPDKKPSFCPCVREMAQLLHLLGLSQSSVGVPCFPSWTLTFRKCLFAHLAATN